MNKQILMTIVILITTSLSYVSYIPQIYKMYRTKSSEDISKESWMLWSLNAILDTLYSSLLGDLRLIIYSLTELSFIFITLFLTLYYNRRNRKELL